MRAHLLAPLLLVACGGPQSPSTDQDWPLPEGAWVTAVTRDPEQFTQLMDSTGRDGWIAFHAHHLDEAVESFDPATPAGLRSRSRAEFALAVLHDDLARFTGYTAWSLFEAWEARGTAPDDPDATAWRSLAAACYGGDAVGWQPGRATEAWDALATTEAPPTWINRAEVHAAALDGEPTLLRDLAREPLVVVPADGFSRTWYDPCVHRTLSDAWLAQVARDLGGEPADWTVIGAWADGGLEGLLFSAWLTPDDLRRELQFATHPGEVGASAPSLAVLGVDWPRAETDDFQIAREQVRQLDSALDQWNRSLSRRANADGRELLHELGLTERLQSELLTARARIALRQGRTRTALAILELTRDVSSPGVGPTNSPALLALMAEAQLRLGHTREALDTLQTLSEVYPEILGLQELVGDLAVLQGLDRQGDSKEN